MEGDDQMSTPTRCLTYRTSPTDLACADRRETCDRGWCCGQTNHTVTAGRHHHRNAMLSSIPPSPHTPTRLLWEADTRCGAGSPSEGRDPAVDRCCPDTPSPIGEFRQSHSTSCSSAPRHTSSPQPEGCRTSASN